MKVAFSIHLVRARTVRTCVLGLEKNGWKIIIFIFFHLPASDYTLVHFNVHYAQTV